MFDIPGAVKTVSGFFDNILDKIVPDAAERQKMALEMAQLAYKEIELANTDRDSARQREMTVKDMTPAVLAYGITAGFFGVLFYILNFDIPNESENVVYVMLGSLGTAWTGIMAYYFGSSAGSAAKHNLLEKLTHRKD